MFEVGIEDFVKTLPGANGRYPYPLFEEIRAAPDTPFAIFVNLTERVVSETLYVAISSPRMLTSLVLPFPESISRVTRTDFPVKTRVGDKPDVAKVKSLSAGADVLQTKSLFPWTKVLENTDPRIG